MRQVAERAENGPRAGGYSGDGVLLVRALPSGHSLDRIHCREGHATLGVLVPRDCHLILHFAGDDIFSPFSSPESASLCALPTRPETVEEPARQMTLRQQQPVVTTC